VAGAADNERDDLRRRLVWLHEQHLWDDYIDLASGIVTEHATNTDRDARALAAEAAHGEVRARIRRASSKLDRADAIRRADELVPLFAADDDAWIRRQAALIALAAARAVDDLGDTDLALDRMAVLRDLALTDPSDIVREVGFDSWHARVRLLRREGVGTARAELDDLIDACAEQTHPGIRHTMALAQVDVIQWLSQSPDTDPLVVIAACDAVIAAHVHDPQDGTSACVSSAFRRKQRALRRAAASTIDPDRQTDLAALADRVAEQHWAAIGDRQGTEACEVLLYAALDQVDAFALDAPGTNDPRILTLTDRIENRFGDSIEPALQAGLALSLRRRAMALGRLGATSPALREDAHAILALQRERFSRSTDPAVLTEVSAGYVAEAWLLLASDKAAAQASLDAAVRVLDEHPDAASSSDLRRWVARALDLTATILGAQDEDPPTPAGPALEGIVPPRPATPTMHAYAEAVSVLADRFAADPLPEIREIVCAALEHLGDHQWRRYHLDEAIGTYLRLIRLFGEDQHSSLEEIVATAYLDLGLVLGQRDRPAEAIDVYDELIARYDGSGSRAVRDVVRRAKRARAACNARLTEESGEFEP
jgi:tetratricopeptide (TPR) repeat protein